MKQKTLKLSLLFLIITLMGASCQEDELIDQHHPFKLKYEIHNVDGQKVTSLKQGEFFSFYFSIENTTNIDCPIKDHHLIGNDELFKVFKKTSNGNEFIQVGGLLSNRCHEIFGCLGEANLKYEYRLPWTIDEEYYEYVVCCRYNLGKQAPLPTGNYVIKYTGSIPYFYRLETGELKGNETGSYNIKYEFEIIK